MKQIPCEIFARIVGYYRPLSSWNAGKIAEFGDRKLFSLKKENSIIDVSCDCEAIKA
jgi:hypothetical protein